MAIIIDSADLLCALVNMRAVSRPVVFTLEQKSALLRIRVAEIKSNG